LVLLRRGDCIISILSAIPALMERILIKHKERD